MFVKWVVDSVIVAESVLPALWKEICSAGWSRFEAPSFGACSCTHIE